MFGSFGNPRALYERSKAASALPEKDVTEAEFVAAMVADGSTEEKAKFHAKIAKGLGAHVAVGAFKLRITDEA